MKVGNVTRFDLVVLVEEEDRVAMRAIEADVRGARSVERTVFLHEDHRHAAGGARRRLPSRCVDDDRFEWPIGLRRDPLERARKRRATGGAHNDAHEGIRSDGHAQILQAQSRGTS